MKHYAKEVPNPYTNKPETKIVNAHSEIDVALPEVNLIFVKNNGIFEGTDTCKHSFKVIHDELGIENCRFYDLRGSFATKALRSGVEIKNVAEILGHSRIETTENYYISSSTENQKNATKLIEKQIQSEGISNIINFK